MDRYVKQVLSMADNGAGVEYIARVVSEPVERVQAVIDGKLDRLEPIRPPRVKRSPKPTKKVLVPVSRPFPALTEAMTDGERIIVLTKHGLSAQKIRRHLKAPLTTKAINNYATKKLGPARQGKNSASNLIDATFMPYVEFCLAKLGKNKFACELCLDRVPAGCVVHHTKYEGATVYDLMYICQSCNCARENVGLA